MKADFIKLFTIIFTLSFIVFSCKKDEPETQAADVTPPVITLNGASNMVIPLNAVFTDPGATAVDAHDGSVSVTSNSDSINPNTHASGIYTITYTAVDAAGNVGSANRTVRVDTVSIDNTPPVVTLLGSNNILLSLNSILTDPGATAFDNLDGAVNVASDFNAANPNLNLVGTYTITYTAADAAGNIGTAIRTVRVKNDAEDFAGIYTVVDLISGIPFTYTQTLSIDFSINYKIHFNRFCDYVNNTDIFCIMNPADSSLTIPNQSSGHDIGTFSGGSCDVQTHSFRTTSFAKISNGFVIDYVDSITTGVGCTGAAYTGTATYTK